MICGNLHRAYAMSGQFPKANGGVTSVTITTLFLECEEFVDDDGTHEGPHYCHLPAAAGEDAGKVFEWAKGTHERVRVA